MQVSAIIAAANRGNIANPDIDLSGVLFNEIIPEFMAAAKRTSWVIRRLSETMAIGDRTLAMPTDFSRMESVFLGDSTYPLPFIGEDESKVVASEVTTAADTPEGWYFAPAEGEAALGRIKFSCPFAAETVVHYSYRWHLYAAGVNELDLYIPTKYQRALIYGLQREIYLDRYGDGDARVTAAANKFDAVMNDLDDDRYGATNGNLVVNLR